MNRWEYRVNALNTTSIISLVLLAGAILAVIFIWNGGTARLYALVALVAVLALIAGHMYAAKVRFDAVGLHIGAGLYRNHVRWSDIVGVVRGPAETRLRWRTNGIGLPGFSLGWFRTVDKRVVFAATGPTHDAIRLYLRGAHDVIVGVGEPDALMHELERRLPDVIRPPGEARNRA
jgi:hypothetical protein